MITHDLKIAKKCDEILHVNKGIIKEYKFILTMFERILKFLRILIYSKFEFSNPDPKQLIVFDNSDIFSLKQHILKNYNYFVLEDRGHLITKFYFSFKIFKNILVYKKYGIILAYKISLIKAVNPKLILTFIHNSENFSKCVRKF